MPDFCHGDRPHLGELMTACDSPSHFAHTANCWGDGNSDGVSGIKEAKGGTPFWPPFCHWYIDGVTESPTTRQIAPRCARQTGWRQVAPRLRIESRHCATRN